MKVGLYGVIHDRQLAEYTLDPGDRRVTLNVLDPSYRLLAEETMDEGVFDADGEMKFPADGKVFLQALVDQRTSYLAWHWLDAPSVKAAVLAGP